MEPEEELSPRAIRDITWDVRDGIADPEDVKRILIYFCSLVEKGQPLPIELRKYLKEGFRTFLDDSGTSIESALGLKRGKSGRPKASEDERIAIATELLRHRLSGSTHEEAISIVGDEFHKGSTVLGEAWAAYQQDAIWVLRLERPSGEYPWTEEEVQRLSKMFSDKSWFISPGNCSNKPT